jgi:hypothetical protein
MKTQVKSVQSFKQLDENVQRKAIKAGQISFAQSYAQALGYQTEAGKLDGSEAWYIALATCDRTYGNCTCGDKNADEQCPSYVEHNLVTWFIDKMYDAGQEAADLGKQLHIGTLHFYTEKIADKTNDIV